VGKLRRLPSALRQMPLRVRYIEASTEAARTQRVEWRAWYKTARWQRLRWSVLVRDLFTCQWPGCGTVETDTALLVADHVTPHRGDERLFWDDANLQCLCKACHDRHKQRVEAGLPTS
jgi:5-methylcytosine-specific restriction endonuclease McrA